VARRDEMARLFDLSRDILLTTDSENAHQALAASIARRFDLEYVAIGLPGADGWLIATPAPGRSRSRPDALDKVLGDARQTLEFDARARTYSGHARTVSAEDVTVDLVPLRLAGARSACWVWRVARWSRAPSTRWPASPPSPSSGCSFSPSGDRRSWPGSATS